MVPGAPGNPTNRGKPGPGRPTKSLKFFLQDVAKSARTQAALKRALSDENCRGFSAALKLVSQYDDEKPAEKRQIVGPVEVHVKVTREGARRTAG